MWHTESFNCGMWDLVPDQRGIKPRFPALRAWSLSRWTTRKVHHYLTQQHKPGLSPARQEMGSPSHRGPELRREGGPSWHCPRALPSHSPPPASRQKATQSLEREMQRRPILGRRKLRHRRAICRHRRQSEKSRPKKTKPGCKPTIHQQTETSSAPLSKL